ncbi:MAG: hypothetical protein N4A59_06145, partial [Marinifilum sp.]|jgi:hypothetical protein|nr:hypothetical protein [Marinifilum sp.]
VVVDNVFTMIERGVSGGFYLVLDVCGTGKRYLVGNGCKPAIMQAPEGGFTNDNSSITLSFLQTCGELFSNYVGSITTQSPETIGAAATAISIITGNDAYQFESDTAGAIKITASGITDADIGRVITVFGGGGANPSKISNTDDFILIGGDQWEGTVGSQISFKIFKDDASSYKLIEVAGSRS